MKDFKTILVLDDDPQFHRLIVPVLTSRGHRVLSAHSGEEANALVLNEPIDLAIVDGQLTDTNGIEWISKFRNDGHDAMVMFVSAYWRDAQSYHTLTSDLGVTLVLHKPVLAAVFGAEVDILLGRGGGAGQVAAESTDFADTLLALREDYARALPARHDELAGLLMQLKAEPTNTVLWSEARTHAHQLRGTAASYGFKEIGEHAGNIEELLVELRTLSPENQAHYDSIFTRIEGQMRSAHELARRAVDEHVITDFAGPIETIETRAIARILVVDDDAAFLDLVDELARQRDLEIIRAGSPGEALDKICMSDVDAALIDVELGAKEVAFRLASDLRALPGYNNLPLAFLSGRGHIEQGDTDDIDPLAKIVCISKPLKADALQSAVRQLVAIRDVRRPKVIIVDDDIDFTRRIAFVLSHDNMEVRILNSTENILEEMQSFAPDALLLDVMMPGVSGFDICRKLRTIPRWRDLPITFLTAYADVDTRIACLRSGGDDYLIKPVVNEELTTRLQMQLQRSRIFRQRVEYDSVSGLLLREPFMNQFATMLSEANRKIWTVTVAFIKLEFNGVGSGEVVSDAVLSSIGSLLQKRLRPEDLKGLWSQDRIILAFRHEPVDTVNGLLRKMENELASLRLPASIAEFLLTAQSGFGRFPADGSTIHELIAAADRRLKDSINLHGENQIRA